MLQKAHRVSDGSMNDNGYVVGPLAIADRQIEVGVLLLTFDRGRIYKSRLGDRWSIEDSW